jgi:ArsR family transcriptional regulator
MLIDDDPFVARANILKAMAHPTRLLLLDLLSKGTSCVNELRSAVGGDTSTVSKHLSVLKHAGIVRDKREGVQVFYALRVPCIMDYLTCVEAVLEVQTQEHCRMRQELSGISPMSPKVAESR